MGASARACSIARAAGSIKGEWKGAETGSRIARLAPFSLAMSSVRSTALRWPEITTWLELPAGYTKFGINGDDGYFVSEAPAGVTNGISLFKIDRGGGSADFPFAVIAPQAGLYPIRVLYYQGGGGANFFLTITTWMPAGRD